MIQKKAVLLLASLTFNTYASILPPNDLQIPSSITETGLSFEQYNQVIDKVEAVYRKEIENRGIKFTINRLWESPTVNAGTLQKNKEWVVNLYGGYARHPLITEDAYTLVFCHELGHHLGGTPRKILSSTKLPGWPSTEGQSDYFASSKCMRKVLLNENNIEVIAELDIPKEVRSLCRESFKKPNEAAICMRTALAGLVTASISASVGEKEVPRFNLKDTNVVDSTFEGHPAPQCRLDTYFQGALCRVHYSLPFSPTDETIGACHELTGHSEGLRPECWFKSIVISEK